MVLLIMVINFLQKKNYNTKFLYNIFFIFFILFITCILFICLYTYNYYINIAIIYMYMNILYFIKLYFFYFHFFNKTFSFWNQNCIFSMDLIEFLNYFKINYIQLLPQYIYIKYNFINFFFPWFFFFFLIYLFLGLSLIFFSNYLSLLGIFFLNICILSLLWISCLYFFQKFFFLNFFYYINFGGWFLLNINYKINFEFFIDSIAFGFAFLTLTIAIFVNIYSFSYFRFEPCIDKFIIFLNWFIISMIFLVFSGNFINLFLGWELIGVTSFLLINFWITKIGVFKAGFKAYSFNKISDLFLLLNIIGFYNISYTLSFPTIIWKNFFFETLYFNCILFNYSYIDILNLFLLGCICIKSVQIGCHIWLPDSMEAPVPASALIHSATLVSAGIFLLIKFTYYFEKNPIIFYLILSIGLITTCYGGLIGSFQYDTKKILAYSTISHCGFLVINYTFLIFEYTILYLYIHGFIKALIFMTIGNINKFSWNNQDLRKMGKYTKFLPFESYVCLLGLLHLSGLPLSFGFYIKHFIFLSFLSLYLFYFIIFFFCLIGGLTGLIYSSRLYWNVFFDFKKSKKKNYYFNFFFFNRPNLLYIQSFYSNMGILGLFLLIYFITQICFIYFLKYTHFSVFFFYNEYVSFYLFYIHNYFFIFNLGFINWIILIFIIFLITFFPQFHLSRFLDFNKYNINLFFFI